MEIITGKITGRELQTENLSQIFSECLKHREFRSSEIGISHKAEGGYINFADQTPLGYENLKPYLFDEPLKLLKELITDQPSERTRRQN
jgi:hypothetical protein